MAQGSFTNVGINSGIINGLIAGRQAAYQRSLDAAAVARQQQEFEEGQQTERYKAQQGLYGSINRGATAAGINSTERGNAAAGSDLTHQADSQFGQGEAPTYIRDPSTGNFVPNPAYNPGGSGAPDGVMPTTALVTGLGNRAQAGANNLTAGAGLKNVQAQQLPITDQSIDFRNYATGANQNAQANSTTALTPGRVALQSDQGQVLQSQKGLNNARKLFTGIESQYQPGLMLSETNKNNDQGSASLTNAAANTTNATTGQARAADYGKLVNSQIGVDDARAKDIAGKSPQFAQDQSVAQLWAKQLDVLRAAAISTTDKTQSQAIQAQITSIEDPQSDYSTALARMSARASGDGGKGGATAPPPAGAPKGFVPVPGGKAGLLTNPSNKTYFYQGKIYNAQGQLIQ